MSRNAGPETTTRHRWGLTERRRQVTRLYMARMTVGAIARELNLSVKTVRSDVLATMAEHKADRDALIEREVAELDAMEADCATRFEATENVVWVEARLAVKRRRAELLGLDAPRRHAVLQQMSDTDLIAFIVEGMGQGNQAALPPGDVVDAEVIATEEVAAEGAEA